jgi:hypothetical protein
VVAGVVSDRLLVGGGHLLGEGIAQFVKVGGHVGAACEFPSDESVEKCDALLAGELDRRGSADGDEREADAVCAAYFLQPSQELSAGGPADLDVAVIERDRSLKSFGLFALQHDARMPDWKRSAKTRMRYLGGRR